MASLGSDMSSESAAFVVFPFTGTMDATTNDATVAPGSLVLVENGEYVVGHIPNQRFSVRKRLGTTKYNATVITGAPTVTSLAEFWRHGTSLTATQKFVACAGGMILKDDGDGVWDTLLASGFGSSTAETHIVIAQGYAIISNNVALEAPRKYDQTSLTALGGTPPDFTAGVYHLRRLFVFGDATAASCVQYCAAGNIEDWSGADTGNFILNEDDGDRVIGASRPFRGRLYFFKGPNIGSIHEIAGSTPTTFTRLSVLTGLPCVAHKGIITTANDIYWPSPMGFHSLNTTQKYGDVEEAFLSRPIQDIFNALNKARLNQIHGFHHPTRNIIGWFVPSAGSTQTGTCLTFNYALGLWAQWTYTGFNGASCMVAQTPSTQIPRLYAGGYAGFVFAGDQTTRSDFDGTQAYTLQVKTPHHLQMPDAGGAIAVNVLHEKQFQTLTTIIAPTGSYNATATVSVDGRTQSATVSLAQTDSSIVQLTETPIADKGRGIQITWEQAGANQDMELLGYAVRYAPAETFGLD